MNRFEWISKLNISQKASLIICFSILIRTFNITISEIFTLNSVFYSVIKMIILGLFIITDIYLFLIIDFKRKIHFILLETVFFVLLLYSMIVNNLGVSLFASYGWILISFVPILISFLCVEDLNIFYNILYKFSYVYAFLCTLIYFFHVRSISTNLIFSYTLLLPYLIQVVKYMESKKILLLLLLLFETFMLFSYGSRGTIMCIIAFFAIIVLKRITKKQLIFLLLIVFSCFVLYQVAYHSGFLHQIYLFFMDRGKYVRVLDLLSSGRFFDNNGRFEIYQLYFSNIIQKPFFGWGLGANLLFEFFPHNVLIEIIFNFGLLSILIFYFGFKLLKNYFLTFYKKDRYNLFLVLICSGLIPLFFSSTYLEFMYFWIFIGFLLCVYKNKQTHNNK